MESKTLNLLLLAVVLFLANKSDAVLPLLFQNNPRYKKIGSNPTLDTIQPGTHTVHVCGKSITLVLRQKFGLTFRAGDLFVGEIKGISQSNVRLLKTSRGTSGAIIQGQEVCQITSQGDGTSVEVELEPEVDLEERFNEQAPSGDLASGDGTILDVAERQSDGKLIDICAFYTSDAKAGVGSDNALSNLIAMMEVEVNEGYENSGLETRARIVHYESVSYDENSGSWTDAVYRFQRTTDGVMDSVHSTRKRYGCDLNILLINMRTFSGTSGIAFVGARKETGFAVVDSLRAFGYDVASHEIGHTLGCGHDAATAARIPGPTGVNSWSKGYVNEDSKKVTIMAYRCFGCERLSVFSQPGTFRGISIGSANSADCTRTIRERTGIVSGFFASSDEKSPTIAKPTATATATKSPAPRPTTAPPRGNGNGACKNKSASLPGGKAFNLTIINRKRQDVDIILINEAGKEVYQMTIASEKRAIYKTFLGFRILIQLAADKRCLRTVVARENRREIILRRPESQG